MAESVVDVESGQQNDDDEEIRSEDHEALNSEDSVAHSIKKVRNYQKVPEHLKQELLRLVINQGIKINQAAQTLNLKYATAKTIVFTYRAQSKPKKNKTKKKKNLEKVEFVPITDPNRGILNVEISIGGKLVQKYQCD